MRSRAMSSQSSMRRLPSQFADGGALTDQHHVGNADKQPSAHHAGDHADGVVQFLRRGNRVDAAIEDIVAAVAHERTTVGAADSVATAQGGETALAEGNG